MRINEVSQSIIGRRVKGVFTGAQITGTIDKVTETEHTVEVHIVLDKPIWWGDDEYTSYWSTARKEDGWGNLQHTEFIDGLEWLLSYQPQSRHFTSEAEMKMIAERLELEKLSREQLQQKRNEVVKFLDEAMDKAEGLHNGRYAIDELMTALMSVTAVIDHYKWLEGMEV